MGTRNSLVKIISEIILFLIYIYHERKHIMFIINAEIREKKGKSFSRKLRTENKFPAILYGLNQIPISLVLDHNSVFNLQKKIDFYKKTLTLLIKDQASKIDKEYKVKVQSVQRHAFKLKLLHIDFYILN